MSPLLVAFLEAMVEIEFEEDGLEGRSGSQHTPFLLQSVHSNSLMSAMLMLHGICDPALSTRS